MHRPPGDREPRPIRRRQVFSAFHLFERRVVRGAVTAAVPEDSSTSICGGDGGGLGPARLVVASRLPLARARRDGDGSAARASGSVRPPPNGAAKGWVRDGRHELSLVVVSAVPGYDARLRMSSD